MITVRRISLGLWLCFVLISWALTNGAKAQSAPDPRADLIDAYIVTVLEHLDSGEFTLFLTGPPNRSTQGELQVTAFDQILFEVRDMRYTTRFRVPVMLPANEKRLVRIKMPENRTGRPWLVVFETSTDFRRTNPYLDVQR